MIRALLLAAFVAHAQQFPADGVRRARAVMDAIFSLDHAAGEKLCRDWIATAPEDPGGYVYLARTKWSEELSTRRALSLERYASPEFFSDDERYRLPVPPATVNSFRSFNTAGITRAKAMLARNPRDAWALFTLGVGHQNEATLEATFLHNWWTAFRQGTSAYRAHAQLRDMHQGLVDARLVPSVYRYVAGTVPWRVRWLAALLGFRGSAEGGRKDLEEVASRALLTNDDARTVLALIYAREKNFTDANRHLSDLRRRFPRNYIVHLDLGSIAMQMKRSDEAARLFREILIAIESKQNGYERLDSATVLNHLGTAERASRRFESALEQHRRSLTDSSATARTRAIAQLETGRVYDLMGRRAEAIAAYRQVRSIPEMPGIAQQARAHEAKAYRVQ
ncbi:MAG: tetratricopeptide repeat protein [Acidobacteria bacterium]|nr:tetratricopeptide repeat protein [Acidobacteriota bacterium]